MSVPRIAVVGSINVDLVARVERLPEPGETVLSPSLSRNAGGKGANQAVAVARLLGASILVGAVGDDPDGQWMTGQLDSAGVNITAVKKVPERSTGTALISVDAAAENSIIVHPGANLLAFGPGTAVPEADAALTQFEIEFSSVLRLADEFPGFLAVNASPARHVPPLLLNRVDLFVVNETEYRQMPELQTAPLVAVTYGSSGAALFEHGVEKARVPSHPVASVVSSVGAGDAFCAALVCALLSGFTQLHSLRIAAAVGAAAVTQHASQPALFSLGHYAKAAAETEDAFVRPAARAATARPRGEEERTVNEP